MCNFEFGMKIKKNDFRFNDENWNRFKTGWKKKKMAESLVEKGVV